MRIFLNSRALSTLSAPRFGFNSYFAIKYKTSVFEDNLIEIRRLNVQFSYPVN